MPSQHQADDAPPVRTIYVTEDAVVAQPRAVSVDEINAVSAERRALSEDEKREVSQRAWADMLAGNVRFRGVLTSEHSNALSD